MSRYSDVIKRLSDDIRAELLNRAKACDPVGAEDGARRYAKFFSDIIGVRRQNFTTLSAVRELAAHESATIDAYTADLDVIEDVIRQTLLDQQRSGDTPEAVTSWAASRIIVWGSMEAIAHHVAIDDGSGDAELARELGEMCWYGVYRRPTP
jgi:hypothetical protein